MNVTSTCVFLLSLCRVATQLGIDCLSQFPRGTYRQSFVYKWFICKDICSITQKKSGRSRTEKDRKSREGEISGRGSPYIWSYRKFLEYKWSLRVCHVLKHKTRTFIFYTSHCWLGTPQLDGKECFVQLSSIFSCWHVWAEKLLQ